MSEILRLLPTLNLVGFAVRKRQRKELVDYDIFCSTVRFRVCPVSFWFLEKRREKKNCTVYFPFNFRVLGSQFMAKLCSVFHCCKEEKYIGLLILLQESKSNPEKSPGSSFFFLVSILSAE